MWKKWLIIQDSIPHTKNNNNNAIRAVARPRAGQPPPLAVLGLLQIYFLFRNRKTAVGGPQPQIRKFEVALR